MDGGPRGSSYWAVPTVNGGTVDQQWTISLIVGCECSNRHMKETEDLQAYEYHVLAMTYFSRSFVSPEKEGMLLSLRCQRS